MELIKLLESVKSINCMTDRVTWNTVYTVHRVSTKCNWPLDRQQLGPAISSRHCWQPAGSTAPSTEDSLYRRKAYNGINSANSTLLCAIMRRRGQSDLAKAETNVPHTVKPSWAAWQTERHWSTYIAFSIRVELGFQLCLGLLLGMLNELRIYELRNLYSSSNSEF